LTARIWRLTKVRFAPGLDGEGARLAGGRWNSPGSQVVYCSAHLSLAALEALVHMTPAMRRPGVFPALVKVALDLPDDLETAEWNGPTEPDRFPTEDETRAFGDAWLAAARTAVLSVPSAIIPEEATLLLNPKHPDFARVAVALQAPFRFDDRLAV
jgi:RES domain-containing protein